MKFELLDNEYNVIGAKELDGIEWYIDGGEFKDNKVLSVPVYKDGKPIYFMITGEDIKSSPTELGIAPVNARKGDYVQFDRGGIRIQWTHINSPSYVHKSW